MARLNRRLPDVAELRSLMHFPLPLSLIHI